MGGFLSTSFGPDDRFEETVRITHLCRTHGKMLISKISVAENRDDDLSDMPNINRL